MLNSWNGKNNPIVTDYNGTFHVPKFEARPELLLHSCAMKLNGEFYVIGGSGGAVREVTKC